MDLQTTQRRLLSLMLDPTQPAAKRAQAGREINQPGDPRPGVIDFKWGADYWCEVPAGEFVMGDDRDKDSPKRTVSLDRFAIAKYPVTYAQYKAFLDAPDGFRNDEWWRGLHLDGLAQQKTRAGYQHWAYANHPAEVVSWYDAMAFCRWLSAKLGYEVRLPNEVEWEKAARGTDGRAYPWGNDYKVAYANINESGLQGGTNLQQTTAVGLYPWGASPYGALDMSGNVWEWTLTEYSSQRSDNVNSNNRRTARGGSWFADRGYARAVFRGYWHPIHRDNTKGFRLATGAPNSGPGD